MIKARYIGVECELQSGKVYPIKTRCTGNKLVVSVKETPIPNKPATKTIKKLSTRVTPANIKIASTTYQNITQPP